MRLAFAAGGKGHRASPVPRLMVAIAAVAVPAAAVAVPPVTAPALAVSAAAPAAPAAALALADLGAIERVGGTLLGRLVGRDLELLGMIVAHGLKEDRFAIPPLELVDRVALLDGQHVDHVCMRLDEDLLRVAIDAFALDLTHDL